MYRKLIYAFITVFFLTLTACGLTEPASEIESQPESITLHDASSVSTAPNSVNFEPGKHLRDENYSAVFNTYDAESDAFTLRINSRVYTIDTGTEVYNCLQENCKAIADVFPISRKPTIYVVELLLRGQQPVAGNEVFLVLADFEDGKYLAALVAALLGTTEPWKVEGALDNVYNGETEIRNYDATLRDYYSNIANLDTLSLFGAYFNSSIVSAETVQIAKQTAASFTHYIVDTYGADAFIATALSNGYRSEWLDSISVNATYTPNYSLGCFDDAVFSQSSQYPLIFCIGNKTFSFMACETFTPPVIMVMLPEFYRAIEEMLETVKSEAPELYSQLLADWEREMRFIFDDTIWPSNTAGGLSFISQPVTLFHEAMHQIFPYSGAKDEGIAEYLSVTFYKYVHQSYYDCLVSDPAFFTGADSRFLGFLKEYYLDKNELLPESIADYNESLMLEAIAVTLLRNPSLKSELTILQMSVLSLREKGGGLGQWSDRPYAEMYLFTKYLVDRFGLEAMLSYAYGSNCLAAFNETANELYADFLGVYLDG